MGQLGFNLGPEQGTRLMEETEDSKDKEKPNKIVPKLKTVKYQKA